VASYDKEASSRRAGGHPVVLNTIRTLLRYARGTGLQEAQHQKGRQERLACTHLCSVYARFKAGDTGDECRDVDHRDQQRWADNLEGLSASSRSLERRFEFHGPAEHLLDGREDGCLEIGVEEDDRGRIGEPERLHASLV
jgi:hypothetical protein